METGGVVVDEMVRPVVAGGIRLLVHAVHALEGDVDITLTRPPSTTSPSDGIHQHGRAVGEHHDSRQDADGHQDDPQSKHPHVLTAPSVVVFDASVALLCPVWMSACAAGPAAWAHSSFLERCRF